MSSSDLACDTHGTRRFRCMCVQPVRVHALLRRLRLVAAWWQEWWQHRRWQAGAATNACEAALRHASCGRLPTPHAHTRGWRAHGAVGEAKEPLDCGPQHGLGAAGPGGRTEAVGGARRASHMRAHVISKGKLSTLSEISPPISGGPRSAMPTGRRVTEARPREASSTRRFYRQTDRQTERSRRP